jgi:uncharacterized delta-60 repeat protein
MVAAAAGCGVGGASAGTHRRTLRTRSLYLAAAVVGALALAAGAAAGAGGLDPSFGDGGKVTTDFKPSPEFVFSSGVAAATAVQADDKIVAAGMHWETGVYSRFALARYDADGSLDPSFGAGGRVTTDFGGGADAVTRALAVAIQPDGKIVAAGIAGVVARFALARYNRNGSLDTTFGSSGKVTTTFGSDASFANAVAIQSDGKIVAAGQAGGDFALARYNRNGTLDASFGSGGRVATDISGHGSFDTANALAIQQDGDLVAAGTTFAQDGDFALARYRPNGTLDRRFGNGGLVTTDFSGPDNWDIAYALALERGGKIVIAGETRSFGPDTAFTVARYRKDGRLDRSFGHSGSVQTRFSGEVRAGASGVGIAAGGRIVAGGWSQSNATGMDFAVARYKNNGRLDPRFGNGGTAITDFGGDDFAASLAIERDARILLAGTTVPGGGFSFALARYLGS